MSDLLLKDQEIADLNGRLETVSSERDTALAQVAQTKDVAELELHRKLAQERSKWEAREERWAKQLASREREVEQQVRLSTARSESPQLPENSTPQEVSHYASPLAMVVTPTTPCTSTNGSTLGYGSVTGMDGMTNTSTSSTRTSVTTSANPVTSDHLYTSHPSNAITTTITSGALAASLAGLPSTLDGPTDVHTPGTWMAQQLPPLNKFSGDEDANGGETIEEWLEQFELVAAVAHWDQSAKLANLVTRLKGSAFAFFRSCPVEQRRSYHTISTELRKRFTPVRIGAVQTSLFHDRKQSDSETVDTYAQDLRHLFHKAYPSSKRGAHEAEAIAQTVLTNQFVAGLRSNIKAKVAGTEGTFGELLTKARFEEAKVRELRSTPAKPPLSLSSRSNTHGQSTPRYSPTNGQSARREQQTRSNGPRQNPKKCYTCGSTSHLAHQCPHWERTGPVEAPGKEYRQTHGRQVAHISEDKVVVTHTDPPTETVAELRHKLKEAEVREAISDVCVTLHVLETGPNSKGVKLGPTPRTQVKLEGEATTALLDTGSPVTIVSLEYLLQVLARTRQPGITPEQWRATVEERLKPTNLNLRNYGGEELNIVRQISVTLMREGHSVTATVQVQVAAPVPLLIGTDVLPQLGFQFLQKDHHECQDLLQSDSDPSGPEPPTKQHSEGGTGVLAEQDATVRLLQATRLPPRHAKLVRVHASCSHVPSTSLFSPDPVVRRDESLQIQESVVEPDGENHFVILVENHTCTPVTLNGGDALGTLHEV